VLLHLPGNVSASSGLLEVLAAWELDPLIVLPLVLLAGLFARGRHRLRRLSQRKRSHDGGRLWYFLAALLTLVLALHSPLHSLSEELFFVHMVQHVLLMSAAAPLLLLANPLPTMIWGLPFGRAALGSLLAPRSAAMRLLTALTRPAVAWWLFVANLWLWHQTAAYQAALEHEALHYAQHLLFFLSAVLFWWPVIGPAPLRSRLGYPARMLYVFAAWIPNSVLGAGFTFAPSVLFSHYASRPRFWGIDPLTDQQLAGLLMWIPGDAVYAAAMMALLLAILRQEDRGEARVAAS
jgi:cytochrome c oxidase assembly factor CtaG